VAMRLPRDRESRPGGEAAFSGGVETADGSGFDAVTVPQSTDDRVEWRSTLRLALTETAAKHGCSWKDLTVLAVQNDPFRIDTPAGHRDGAWLAMHAERLGLQHSVIHLRGMHYVLITAAPDKPNGEVYLNTAKDWTWLQEKAADAARWLGYIPFDRIIDKRNNPPVVRRFSWPEPTSYIRTGIRVDIPDVEDLRPEVDVEDFIGVQPYKIVLMGEKSSLDDVLAPIATVHEADLYLPTGEPSDTMLHQMARIAAEDGRPMVVLYFSDCDPAGWHMPLSVARKLQALKVGFFPGLEFEVHRVALTPQQVREYGLPSTPLKDSERRADRWRDAMGIEQTEIDALASLRPDLLRQIARDAIAPFYDSTLDTRVFNAKVRWLDTAQAIVNDATDSEELERLRREATIKLNELRDEIDAINRALRVDTSRFALPPLIVPTAELNDASNGLPLLDSRWPFAEQCQRLIDSKAYRENGTR
jgi:hypothetical protein